MTTPFLQIPYLAQLVEIGKIVGTLGVAGGVIWGLIKVLVSVVRKVTGISDNVTLLLTNHLPHVEAAMIEHAKKTEELSSRVLSLDTKIDGVSTRVDDTKDAIHTLGASFLRHLENSSHERVVLAASAAENKTNLATLAAASKLESPCVAVPSVVVKVSPGGTPTES